MIDFKVIYYIVIIMFSLLISVFVWGAITYKKTKNGVKFLNVPLLVLTSVVAGIGFILTFIPIFMKVWDQPTDFVKSNPGFISILVFEFLFMIAFLVLAYTFAYDFGIILDKKDNRLQFFGQTNNTEKIIALEEKKYSLKIIYEQGYKNIKKKITVFTPKAKDFIRENLSDIIAINQEARKQAAIQEQLLKDQAIDVDNNISEVNSDVTSENILNQENQIINDETVKLENQEK